MSQHDLSSVKDVLVSYSADEMPTSALVEIQRQTLVDYQRDEIEVQDAFRLVNLLLTIAIQKLQTYMRT